MSRKPEIIDTLRSESDLQLKHLLPRIRQAIEPLVVHRILLLLHHTSTNELSEISLDLFVVPVRAFRDHVLTPEGES